MATIKLKTGIISALVVASVVTPLVLQHQAQARLHFQEGALRQQTDQLAKLQEENERLSNLLARAKSPRSLSNDQLGELMRQQYAHDNNGRFPGEVSQLKPYFKSPIEDAVLRRWAVLPRSKLVKGLQAQLEEDWYITQKAPVNKALDQRILVGLKRLRSFGYGYAPPDFWDIVP